MPGRLPGLESGEKRQSDRGHDRGRRLPGPGEQHTEATERPAQMTIAEVQQTAEAIAAGKHTEEQDAG